MTGTKLKKVVQKSSILSTAPCYRAQFRHWRTGKLIRAVDYGHTAFRFHSRRGR